MPFEQRRTKGISASTWTHGVELMPPPAPELRIWFVVAVPGDSRGATLSPRLRRFPAGFRSYEPCLRVGSHRPLIAAGENRPSGSETLQQFARILTTGDPRF